MKLVSILITLTLSLGLLGCRRDERASTADVVVLPKQGAAPKTSGPARPREDTVAGRADSGAAPTPPTTATTPPAARGAPQVNRHGVQPQRTFEIDGAGEDGWTFAGLSGAELGKRVDKALMGLRDAQTDVRFDIQNAEVKGQSRLKVRVVNPSTFRVEYTLASDPTITHFAVADGKKRANFEGGKWGSPRPVSTSVARGDGQALAARWAEAFPREALAALTQRRATWEPLLSALESGARGYRMVVESKQMPVNGVRRPFYRVLAERESDGTRYEMRFDGRRFLPLTLRVNREAPGKPPLRAQWTAGWRFGAPIDPTETRLPRGL